MRACLVCERTADDPCLACRHHLAPADPDTLPLDDEGGT